VPAGGALFHSRLLTGRGPHDVCVVAGTIHYANFLAGLEARCTFGNIHASFLVTLYRVSGTSQVRLAYPPPNKNDHVPERAAASVSILLTAGPGCALASTRVWDILMRVG